MAWADLDNISKFTNLYLILPLFWGHALSEKGWRVLQHPSELNPFHTFSDNHSGSYVRGKIISETFQNQRTLIIAIKSLLFNERKLGL